jgi:hypothetical protein
LYDELSPQQRETFGQHLQKCDECAREFSHLKQTTTLMNRRQLNEPDQAFWNGFWNRLQPQLEQKPTQMKRFIDWLRQVSEIRIFEPRLVYQLAIAIVLIAAGIFIGKLIFSPVNEKYLVNQYAEKTGSGESAQLVDVRTQRYLERSKVLLMGLVNFNTSEEDVHGLNFGHQQRISEKLVSEARFLKDNVPNRRLVSLISDLEIILMQIANLESEMDINGIELIKSGIDRQGILLKINLEEIKRTSESFDSEQHKQKHSQKNKI